VVTAATPDRVALHLNRRPIRSSWSARHQRRAQSRRFYWKGKVHVSCAPRLRRKSFFAIAKARTASITSASGTSLRHPRAEPETNSTHARHVSRGRLDYGVFAPSEGSNAPPATSPRQSPWLEWCGPRISRNGSAAELKTPASQQRNVVLHPSSCRQICLYTRPMDVSSTLDPAAESAGRSAATSAPASPDRR